MTTTSRNRPSAPLRLHRFAKSGHSHRAELFIRLLQLPVELVDVDLAGGAHKRAEFLRLNAFGQVPVLQDGEHTIADSNAILVYLAKRYGDGAWLPEDPAGAAAVQRWLSVAAGQLAFGPAAARLITVFKARFNADEVIARAHALFEVMEAELQRLPFLAGSEPTIADIANYSYTAHAPEGRVSLESYPHVRAWLRRIEQLPGFVAMPATQVA
jgi:glutathione S-transferase